MNRDNNQNVIRNPNFTQVCVWPGTTVTAGAKEHGVSPDQLIADFESFLLEQTGARCQYLEEIETLPDLDEDGFPIKGTGGRIDTFFAMHQDDVQKAAVPRLQMGIRWLEDVLAPNNYRQKLYPDRVRQYQTWPMDGTNIKPSDNMTPEEEAMPVTENEAAPAPEGTANKQPTAPSNLHKLADLLVVLLTPLVSEAISKEMQGLREELAEVRQNVAEHEMTLESQQNRMDELDLSDEHVVQTIKDALLDSSDFNKAVESVVESMDFSITIDGGRRRRY